MGSLPKAFVVVFISIPSVFGRQVFISISSHSFFRIPPPRVQCFAKPTADDKGRWIFEGKKRRNNSEQWPQNATRLINYLLPLSSIRIGFHRIQSSSLPLFSPGTKIDIDYTSAARKLLRPSLYIFRFPTWTKFKVIKTFEIRERYFSLERFPPKTASPKRSSYQSCQETMHVNCREASETKNWWKFWKNLVRVPLFS